MTRRVNDPSRIGEAVRAHAFPPNIILNVNMQHHRNESPVALAARPASDCIHHLFESQARLAPDSIAVTDGTRRLTYRELDDHANRLSLTIRKHGAGPGNLVGICLERSLEVVVSILAILKAGAAYLPLDPVQPMERLEFMLADSGARLLLTAPGPGAGFQAANAQQILVDLSEPASAPAQPVSPLGPSSPDHLAYVIYTSGSTGRPKGVLVTHRNVVRLFTSTAAWFRFGPEDVFSLFHTFAFDFSVFEIWGALLHGGRLVVVPYPVSRSTEEFSELLAREKVTVLSQTPSAFRQLLRVWSALPPGAPDSLRLIVFGGEALELQSLKPWFDRHGEHGPVLVNMYGITETTVHVTYRVIRPIDLAPGRRSVIGVPIPDLSLHLLDENLQPVPRGETGEIFVGGAGVARGYLNRPELTAARFLPDPFSPDPAARLYRSGDLARYAADGELEYLGRKDFQVKIRGFRVELGEIESELNRDASVRESVVVDHDGPDGEKCLVGYVAVEAGSTASVATLRSRLQQHLPEYMVPAALVLVDKLPLNGNGKVDRRALPPPDLSARATADYLAPRNPLETTLAALWQEVLGVERVGVHDDFFALGGHSLLAGRVISRLRGEVGLDVPLRAIFEAPTPARLAARVDLLLWSAQARAEAVAASASGIEL